MARPGFRDYSTIFSKKPIELQRREAQAKEAQKMALATGKEKSKNLERDMMYHATYGADAPQLQSELESSTTGYNPGTPASRFAKEPMTLDMMKSKARSINAARFRRAPAVKDNSEAALGYIMGVDPEAQIQTGTKMAEDGKTKIPVYRKVSRGDVMRQIATRFKDQKILSDPRFQKALSRFGESGTPAPSAAPASQPGGKGFAANIAEDAGKILQHFKQKIMGEDAGRSPNEPHYAEKTQQGMEDRMNSGAPLTDFGAPESPDNTDLPSVQDIADETPPEYDNPEDAINAGHPAGTIVIINGKRARIDE